MQPITAFQSKTSFTSEQKERKSAREKKDSSIIALSVPLENQAKEPMPPVIQYSSHEEGAKQAAIVFGLEPSDFPESKAWATETVTMTTHTGPTSMRPGNTGQRLKANRREPSTSCHWTGCSAGF